MVGCPACGGSELRYIDDVFNDLRIFRCARCGESYAANMDDVRRSQESVLEHWAVAYAQAPKVIGGDDGKMMPMQRMEVD